ncbi:phosphatidic acid phosphatase [Sphingomonas sp. Sph1(2015)]|jgi:acid phosphatase (class A)|uniref:acid phosphatase n=1 Tax=Sphingomonas sp. Sph1(2015) TaxID=1628084 RepID=UPI0009765DFA|nr:phosphatase PAP2 family protein [Sphingomonas sp. Sph1(2015)]OMJ31769.1 phosphatidic acid phosphatase [Sphingomonas sp. Sph1(2015)]
MSKAVARAVAAALIGVACTAVMAQPREGDEPSHYLPATGFDLLAVLPPAPRPDDARGKADRAIFRQTRRFVGSPRWTMATNDVKLGEADMARDFSCALGIALTPQNAPATMRLIDGAGSDTARGSGIAKNHYKRQRPYLIDRGPTCQPASELKGSYDYPSGHTTAGWTWAMLLAEIAPDRAESILARGRAFGESRIVCGVHNASAVEAGRLSATVTLTAVSQNPAFQHDLAAARAEVDALRRNPATPRPDPALCQREAALVAQPIF